MFNKPCTLAAIRTLVSVSQLLPEPPVMRVLQSMRECWLCRRHHPGTKYMMSILLNGFSSCMFMRPSICFMECVTCG